jgi:hypothetical protein
MSRNRKSNRKKKKQASRPNSGEAFTCYRKAMYGLLRKLKMEDCFQLFSKNDLRLLFAHRFRIRQPVATEGSEVTARELHEIGRQIQIYYRTDTKMENLRFSLFEIQIANDLYWLIGSERIPKARREVLQERFYDLLQMDSLDDNTIKAYLICFFRVLTMVSDVRKKYYSLVFRAAAVFPDDPTMEFVTEISAYPARSKLFEIGGHNRPAFQVGMPQMNGSMKWILLPSNLLGHHYQGRDTELKVYIQSHALNRLAERLDLLDEAAIRYSFWENTQSIESFEFYRDYLLLPYKLHDIRIGYLAAKVVDGVIVFRTFLFITHSSTPEGDRLKQISGLEWNDISYWRIDRLSTFLQADPEKYPGLAGLFKQAGIDDIFQLREEDLNIQAMQEANLEGLMNYIQQGQQETLLPV